MKIKCIDTKESLTLTLGKIYEALDEDTKFYFIKNDSGRELWYLKRRFEIVKEDKEMKFKVGDKVRVKEDLVEGNYYGQEAFTDLMDKYVGKIIKIEGICGNAYISEGWHWTDEMLEEVKAEVKEKTFREVIADIKEGEVWKSPTTTIKCVEGNGNVVIEDNKKDQRYRFTMLNQPVYKLQRKQYSFEEAFKAYGEGKEIESCEGSFYKYKRMNDSDFVFIKENEHWLEFAEHEEAISFNEIRGKWYINN